MRGSVVVRICLGVYHCKLAFSCSKEKELLYCCRRGVSKDDFVGVNVLEGDFGNLLVRGFQLVLEFSYALHDLALQVEVLAPVDALEPLQVQCC